MEINQSFFDKDGLLNDKMPVTPSENRSLWLVEAAILYHMVQGQRTLCTDEKCELLEPDRVYANLMKLWDGKTFHALANWNEFKDEGFSRDNIIAVTAFGLYFNKSCNDLGWKMMPYRRYLQPQDIIWLAFAAGGIPRLLARPFMWFLALNMIYSSLRMKKLSDYGPLDTDGMILSFIRMTSGSKYSWTLKKAWEYIQRNIECDLWCAIKNYSSVGDDWYKLGKPTLPWRCVFRMYFNNHADHPINTLSKEIWR